MTRGLSTISPELPHATQQDLRPPFSLFLEHRSSTPCSRWVGKWEVDMRPTHRGRMRLDPIHHGLAEVLVLPVVLCIRNLDEIFRTPPSYWILISDLAWPRKSCFPSTRHAPSPFACRLAAHSSWRSLADRSTRSCRRNVTSRSSFLLALQRDSVRIGLV